MVLISPLTRARNRGTPRQAGTRYNRAGHVLVHVHDEDGQQQSSEVAEEEHDDKTDTDYNNITHECSVEVEVGVPLETDVGRWQLYSIGSHFF